MDKKPNMEGVLVTSWEHDFFPHAAKWRKVALVSNDLSYVWVSAALLSVDNLLHAIAQEAYMARQKDRFFVDVDWIISFLTTSVYKGSKDRLKAFTEIKAQAVEKALANPKEVEVEE